MIPPVFPKGWLERWTADHPRLALLVLAFGLAMVVFLGCLFISDALR